MWHCVIRMIMLSSFASCTVVCAIPPSEPSPGPQFPHVADLVFAKHGAVLVWGEAGRAVRDRSRLVWCDVTTGNRLKPLQGFDGFAYSSGAIATTPDGKYLAATPFTDGVRVWDLERGEQLTFRDKSLNSTALAFVPSDSTLLVKYAKDIVAYDVPSLERKGTFEITFTGRVFGGPSQSIAVSADGKRVAALFNGVRLWDVATRKELAEIRPGDAEFKEVAISPDGNLVAYSTRGPTHVWDYNQRAERFAVLPPSRFMAPTVAFSPTENVLAMSTREHGLHFSDLQTGEVVRKFPQFKDGAYPVAFSPDGKRIAAAHGGEIRIIDLATNKEVVIKIPPIEEQKAE